MSDPVTIITGAAGGIGRDVAMAVAALGHQVILADINESGLEAVAGLPEFYPGKTAHVSIDITSPSSAAALVAVALDRFGRIDALIHCAGIDAPRGNAWELGETHWRRIIEADLNGAWWCTQAVLPAMLNQQRGRIILVGSSAGRQPSLGTSVAYNAAKAGVTGLVIGLSSQVESHGIRVNVIAPGPTGTGAGMTDEERADYRRVYPLGEGGTLPVVEACKYLLGPGGDWLSGSVLNVSGGRVRG
jgi:NAD(P)-dependent dehydrogenase (short-subunit alcohol dehydrogenase family)